MRTADFNSANPGRDFRPQWDSSHGDSAQQAGETGDLAHDCRYVAPGSSRAAGPGVNDGFPTGQVGEEPLHALRVDPGHLVGANHLKCQPADGSRPNG